MRFGIARRLKQNEFPQEKLQRCFLTKNLIFFGGPIDQNA